MFSLFCVVFWSVLVDFVVTFGVFVAGFVGRKPQQGQVKTLESKNPIGFGWFGERFSFLPIGFLLLGKKLFL